jgi:hypothetical protein
MALSSRAPGTGENRVEATMACSRRCAASIGILALVSALGAKGLAAEAPTIELTLTPESSYTSGCVAPCLCPVQIAPGMSGKLIFHLSDSNPLFSTYDVEADLIVPGDPPRSVKGAGTYKVGGEVAVVQEMALDLSTNGGPFEPFRSGSVPGGADFPAALEISVSSEQGVCFATSLAISAKPPEPPRGGFVRGDSNSDGSIDLSDGVFILNALFGGGRDPSCNDSADADDSGDLNLTDGIFLLDALFRGTPGPPPPSDACGEDPTPDGLDCASYPPCAA